MAGVASMLTIQLFVDGDTLGALNLYARTPRAFEDESEHIGLLFAAHAAVAFAGVRKQKQLAAGMATRDLIGQAKGRLIERYDLDGDQAFKVLTRASREANRKLRDVAEDIALGKQFPRRSDPAARHRSWTPAQLAPCRLRSQRGANTTTPSGAPTVEACTSTTCHLKRQRSGPG